MNSHSLIAADDHGPLLPRSIAPRARAYRDLPERLWSFVWSAPGPLDTDCWLWTGAVNPKGYGMISVVVRGRPTSRRVHRVAYEIEVGPIPFGLDLDHLCDLRQCLRPLHLEPVTHLENVRRTRSAGR